MPGTGTIALGSVCFGNPAIASRGLTLEKAAITCSQVMTMPSDDMQNPVPTILNGCCLGSNGPGLCIAMATVADFIRSSTLRSGIGAILRALRNGSRLSCGADSCGRHLNREDRKSTRLNSSHLVISYAVFCLKKKKKT